MRCTRDTSNKVSPGDKLPQAVRVLDEALARDPKFLAAWCLLARAHCSLYFWGFDHTPTPLGTSPRGRSMPPWPSSPTPVRRIWPGPFTSTSASATTPHARTELDFARRALPNEAEVFAYTGYIARREGRWAESTRDVERALELDPRNFFTLQTARGPPTNCFTATPTRFRIYDRALTVVPGDPVTRILRAELEIDSRADLRPFSDDAGRVVEGKPEHRAGGR